MIILWYCINIVDIILPSIVALVYLKNNKLFNNSKINKIIKYLLLFYLVIPILAFFSIDLQINYEIEMCLAYFSYIVYILVTVLLIIIYLKLNGQQNISKVNKRLKILSLFCLIIRIITIIFRTKI